MKDNSQSIFHNPNHAGEAGRIESADHPTITPLNGLHWLNAQTWVPGACLFARLNLMGGMILWELGRRRVLRPRFPRLFLYGRSVDELQLAAHNIGWLMGMPTRNGRTTSRGWSTMTMHSSFDEILVMPAPKEPGLSIDDDRHGAIVLYGDFDAHAYHATQIRRVVLPVRISPHTAIRPAAAQEPLEPNPVGLACDHWCDAGKPKVRDGGHYAWPIETANWRSTVEDVLVHAGWPWLPRSIALVDDF